MPVDPSISLAAKAPSISDAMGNISSIIGARQGMINLQRSQATLPYEISSAEAGARTAQAGANVAESTVQPRIQAAKATADQATANAQSAQLNYQMQSLTALGQQVNQLQYDPNLNRGKVLNFIASTASNMKTPSAMVAQMVSKVPDTDDPVELKGYLQHVLVTLQDKANQLGQMTTQPTIVGTGQQAVPINVGGNVPGVPIGAQVGPGIQQQVPPTAPTVRTDAQGNIIPGYVGAQSTSGFVPSGPPIGTEKNIAGTVDAVNNDWAQTMAQAAPAKTNIGVLENMKSLADRALTGPAADRLQFYNGLLNMFGVSPAPDVVTATNLLMKNQNMLSLFAAGGGTNLKTMLAEGSNPNTHMDTTAIKEAADQVIGQQELALAKQKYLNQFKSDPQKYTVALGNFNRAADPRIFQIRDMSPQQIREMKRGMSKQQLSDFESNIKFMQDAGIVQ